MGIQIGPSSSKLLSEEAIRAGEDLGLNFICLMCKHWSLAYEWVRSKKGRKLTRSEYKKINCNKKKCYGPMVGGVFDEHEGPLENCMSDFCYLCGCKAIYSFERIDTNSVWSIGVCDDHINVLDEAGIGLGRGIEHESQGEKRN